MASWSSPHLGANMRSPAHFPNRTSGRVFPGCSSIRDYEVIRKLGEGTFGEVHQARSRKTGAIVALKKILMHNEKDGFPITALREIKLLKLLDHINVLTLEEMAVEHTYPKNTEKKKRSIMYMVTPYMDHDLSGLLENPSVKFTVPQIKCYMLQLLKGTAYLHDQRILHRDMKAANLLINNRGILQIADFGLARHYEGDVPRSGHTPDAIREYTVLVVTRWYRPPELLLQLRKYTPAIDLWGVGCVFGEMLFGKPILSGESDQKQLELIFDLVGSPSDDNMPGWRNLPGGHMLNPPFRHPNIAMRFKNDGPGAISLLTDLLKLDWRKRINAIDAMNHRYFKERPLPARPEDIPHFEESHELDRREKKGQRVGLPPAPRGYAVGEDRNGGYPNGDTWVADRRQPHNNGHHSYADNRGPRQPHQSTNQRREQPRNANHGSAGGWDGARSERPHVEHRDRDRDHAPRRDVYVPSYRADGGRRDDGPRDDRSRHDRRRWDDRDDRHHGHPHRERLQYEESTLRGGHTRSRSRSPIRERTRGRESLDRDMYRR